MSRKAKIVTISFKTPEQHKEAVRKARQRQRGLSAQIQYHFANLPDLDREEG